MRPRDPFGYGRLVQDEERGTDRDRGTAGRGREDRAHSAVQFRRHGDRRGPLFPLVDRIGNDNAKGEYYLTDIVAEARGTA